jgi:16S rRNA processing protein RimM
LDRKDCFKLGFVSKVHGIKGELTVLTQVSGLSFINKPESVFIELNGRLVPFFVESVSHNNKGIRFKFDGVNSIPQAELLKNSSVYIPLTYWPEAVKTDNEFHSYLGYSIKDSHKGIIGILEKIIELPHQNLLQIYNPEGTEILVPAAKEFIVALDAKNKELELNIPEGLVDLYLK